LLQEETSWIGFEQSPLNPMMLMATLTGLKFGL
jgi:hypothetical protein